MHVPSNAPESCCGAAFWPDLEKLAKRWIHSARGGEALGQITVEKNDVHALGKPSCVLTAHAATEIVFRQNVVAVCANALGRALTCLRHIRAVLDGWRVEH